MKNKGIEEAYEIKDTMKVQNQATLTQIQTEVSEAMEETKKALAGETELLNTFDSLLRGWWQLYRDFLTVSVAIVGMKHRDTREKREWLERYNHDVKMCMEISKRMSLSPVCDDEIIN